MILSIENRYKKSTPLILIYMKRKYIKWSIQDTELIKKLYARTPKDEILALIDKDWNQIKSKCRRLGLQREAMHLDQMKSNVYPLLEDTVESYYWIGFCLADAHISKQRITLTISLKDEGHLLKFSKYIESNIRYGECFNFGKVSQNCTVSANNSHVIPQIRDKFGIVSNKTQNPPLKIENISNTDLLFSLFCGFLDGDGHIKKAKNRKSASFGFQLHQTWLQILNVFHNLIMNITKQNIPDPKINNRGYASWSVNNIIVSREIKKYAIKLNLPVMDRKWKLIDETAKSKYELTKEYKKNVDTMISNGIQQKEIAKILGISQSAVSILKKKTAPITGAVQKKENKQN